jgi:hypothetical protein
MSLRAECNEKGGVVLRKVWPVRITPARALELQDKMSTVPNFLDKDNPLGVFFQDDSVFFQVDDVGVLAFVNIKHGRIAHAHITFWDRRLRGREKLCEAVAETFMLCAGLQVLATAIPPDRPVLMAFAKRVGFEPARETPAGTLMLLHRWRYHGD